MGFQEYAITMNVYPKRVEKVIEKEEEHIQRLQIDALSERKQSLVTDLVAKQEKVNELQQGKVIPLTSLYVVRIWHRDPDILAARAASLKNAFISMGGARTCFLMASVSFCATEASPPYSSLRG
jgi:hypothetical protein